MKTSRMMLAVSAFLATAFLAGCASSPTASTEPQSGRYYVDGAYVQAVERAARSRGVSVHWINAPERAGGDQPAGD